MAQFVVATCPSHDRNIKLFLRCREETHPSAVKKFAISPFPNFFTSYQQPAASLFSPGCPQGKKMAICTDNITDVTLKDMVAESEDFSNFVGAFVCQSTIIPSDSKGFRTALALQSNSLADRFLGTCFVLPSV